jgi:hypothetical protein
MSAPVPERGACGHAGSHGHPGTAAVNRLALALGSAVHAIHDLTSLYRTDAGQAGDSRSELAELGKAIRQRYAGSARVHGFAGRLLSLLAPPAEPLGV